MATNNGDNCIGRLTLDITDIDQKVKKINEYLKLLGVGVNVDLSKKITAEVKKQLDSVQKEIEGGTKKINEAAQKAIEAIQKIGNASASTKESDVMDKIWQKVYAQENKMQAEADKALAKSEARAAKEAAAIEKAEERKRVAREREEKRYQQVWDKIGYQERVESDKTLAKIEENEAKQAAATERAEERKRAAREKEEKRYQQVWDKATYDQRVKKAEEAARKEEEALNGLIAKVKEYYDLLSQQQQAKGSENYRNQQLFGDTAAKVLKEINAALGTEAKNVTELDKVLQDHQDVLKATESAQIKYQAAVNKANQTLSEKGSRSYASQDSARVKQEIEDIKAYATALSDVYAKRAEIENAVSSGRTKEGSEAYNAMQQSLIDLAEAADRARNKLSDDNLAMVEGAKTISTRYREIEKAIVDARTKILSAQNKLNEATGRGIDVSNENESKKILEELKQKYTDLTAAIKNYQSAKKMNDTTGMQDEQKKIDTIMQYVNGQQQAIANSDMEASVKQQILNMIQQCTVAEKQHASTIGTSVTNANELETTLTSIATRYLSLMAVIRAITSLISNTVEYVTEYSDKMNEIQMITLKTDAEVEKLSKRYREMASDLNASSKEIASAAVFFTRQGLETQDIEKRLKNVTMYAKAANVEFEDAAEIMTAVINSMKLVEQEADDGRDAAQRVADVFLTVGDSAATSGEEIGKAMQKAAAAAGSFGVSFEKMVSYIATVSETTRQDAKTIGTALNTIVARLHSIRTTGYNAEDETKINDVAKALSKIDVQLMDQYGEWRAMEDVFEDVADKWNTLNGKTRSYIATAMAGVKQQNVFLALMNDMAKGVENGSRYYELHEEAINSAGSAEKKYAVYKDSVAASQERLNIAQEKFYSLLDSSVIKGWNDALAGFVNLITHGADVLGGVNIILPIIAAGVVTVAVAIKGLNASLGTTVTLAALLEKHPIMMAIAAGAAVLAGAITLISAAVDGIETAAEKYERYSNQMAQSQQKLSSLQSLQQKTNQMFDELSAVDDANKNLDDYNDLLLELCRVSPTAAKIVKDLKEGFMSEEDAVEALNEELEKMIQLQGQTTLLNLSNMLGNWQPSNTDEDRSARDSALQLQEVIENWKRDFADAMSDDAKFAEELWHQFTTYTETTDEPYLTDEMNKKIQELKNAAMKNWTDWFTNEDDRWLAIATEIWYSYFFGDGANSIAKTLIDEANDLVNTVVKGVTERFNLDSVKSGVLREQLTKTLFGDDNILSVEEYENAGKILQKAVDKIIGSGLDISSEETINYIVGQIFGTDIPDAVKDGIQSVANDQDIVDKISQAYQGLIDAGYTNADIKNLLAGKSVSDWGDAIEIAKNELRDKLGAIFDPEAFANADVNNLFEQLDLTTLKMLTDLVDLGVETDKLLDIFSQSGSVDEFAQRLGILQKTLMTTEGTDAGNYVKQLKEAQKEIDSLESAIDSIAKTGGMSMEDWLNLTETYESLKGVNATAEEMSKALGDLRDKAKESQKEIVKQMLLDSNSFKLSSQYSSVEKDTLGEYREHLIETGQSVDELDKYMNTAAETLLAFLTGTDNATEGTDSLDKQVKALMADLNLLDKSITALEKGEGIDFADLYNLATLHPEILAVIDDTERLKETLTNLRQEGRDKQKGILVDMLYKDEGFMKNSKYAESGAKNLSEYVNQHAEAATEVAAYLDGIAEKAINVGEVLGEAFDTTKIKDYQTDISNIGKVIKSIAEDNAVDFDDILNLAQVHPEIMNSISDLQKLKEKLVEIKNIDRANQKESLIDMLLQDADFSKGTSFGNDMKAAGFSTLQQWIDGMNGNDDRIKGIREEVAKLVEELVRWADVESGSVFDISAVESYKKQVKEIDDAIEGIEKNGRLDFDDILGLSKTHPELINYIGSMDTLKTKLQEIRETDREAMKQTLIDSLMGSKEFMKGFVDSNGNVYADKAEEYGNLQAYVDKFPGMRDTIKNSVAAMVADFINLGQVVGTTFEISNVKKFEDEIQNLQDIVERMTKGESIKFADILGIAETHPEMLNLIGDIEQLKTALEGVAATTREDQITELTGVLMGNDFIRKSKWGGEKDDAGNLYASLDAYVAAHAEAKEEVSQYVKDIIQIMLDYEEAERKAFNSSTIKAYSDEIKQLDELIKTLGEGGSINYEDILGIADSHPEILAAISSTNELKAGLEAVRDIVTEDRKQTLFDNIMNNEKFFQKIKWDFLPENAQQDYTNLKAYTDANTDAYEVVKDKVNELIEKLLNYKETEEEVFSLDEVEKYQKEIESLDSAIKKLSEGKHLNFSEIIGIAKAHPELIEMTGSVDTLKAKLEELRSTDRESQITDFAKELKKTAAYANMSIDDIEEKLRTFFKYVEQEEEKTESYTLASVKKYETEINNIAKLIENINGGGDVNFSDILGIAESHPEILLFMNDLDAMAAKLEEIRKEQREQQKESLVNAILGDEDFFKNSQWYDPNSEKKFKNLTEYIAGNNDVTLETITEELGKIIDKAEETGGVLRKAFSLTPVKNLRDEIDLLKSVIDKLNNDEVPTFDELMSIATNHPGIIAMAGDLDELKEKLIAMRDELPGSQKEEIAKELAGNAEYVAGLIESGRVSAATETDAIMEKAREDAQLLIDWGGEVKKVFDTNDLKKYNTELDKLNKLIKGIDQNGKLDISDIIDLSGDHPEILHSIIGSPDEIKGVLEQMRSVVVDELKTSLKDAMLTSTKFMETSGFKDYGFATFKDLIDNDGDEATAAVEYIQAIIDAAIVLDETVEDAFDVKTLKTFNSEIANVNKALESLAENQKIDADTVLNIAEKHPEFLLVLGDATKMREELEKIKATLKNDEKSSFIDMILKSKDFMKISQWSAYAEQFETLEKYMESLGEDDAKVVNDEIELMANNFLVLVDAMKEAEEANKTYADKLKETAGEMEKINSMITDLKEEGSTGLSDFLGLAEAHPEMLAVINDEEQLLALMREYNKIKSRETIGNVRGMINDNTAFFANSPYASMGASYSAVIANSSDFTKEELDNLEAYMNSVVIGFLGATNQLKDINKDVLEEWMLSLFPDSNPDLLQRKIVDIGDDIQTVLTTGYTASKDGKKGLKWNQDIVMNFTPITPDGEKLTPEALDEYVEKLLKKSKNLDELYANDKKDKNLLIGTVVDFENFDEGIKRANMLAQVLHLLQAAYYDVSDANKSWLEVQYEQQKATSDLNWASSNGFTEQIGELQRALSSGGIEDAKKIWDGYDENMRKSISETYPDLLSAMTMAERALNDTGEAIGDVTSETNRLSRALNNAARSNSVRHLTATNDAINKLKKGTISATDAYEEFNKELNKITKANEDINDVREKRKEGTEILSSDISNLASVLGLSTDEVMADLNGAIRMFDELIADGGELEDVFYRLNEAAFIRITGTSDVDFSQLQDGLISVQNLTEEAIELLQATGQYEVQNVSLGTKAWVQQADGTWDFQELTSITQVLRPTGKNPFKGTLSTGNRHKDKDDTKTRSSGGGRRNDDSKGKSDIDMMLDRMAKVKEYQDWQLQYYEAKQKYYESTGELQGVIKSIEKENEVLEKENATLKKNVDEIGALIDSKQKELDSMDKNSDGYEELSEELEKLIDAYRDYTLDLENNTTKINENNKAMEEQRKKIRQMEIDVKDEIYAAIEDRENKKKAMLQGEIDMENKVLDVIKARYEKERDMIVDATQAKIDALTSERDLLSEQLELRKKLEDKEDKAKKLAQLELQYQRISTDPTRAKEAKKLSDQISAMRKEMAWEAAEEEVKAQQDSMDQQISSLEDYVSYVNEYYDELLNNPKKLIAEMKDVLSMTDEQIIEWLKANDEEYANATEARRKQMVDEWQNTLDEMHGTVKTYWDEVEEIYKLGDDAIIEFLKANSRKYAEAGKLQAEAYVEEWKKMLTDLNAALKDVSVSNAPTTPIVTTTTNNSSSSSGGGQNPGGGNIPDKVKHGYSFIYGGKTYEKEGFKSLDDSTKAMQKRVEEVVRASSGKSGSSYIGQGIKAIIEKVLSGKYKGYSVYKNGGLADYTGLAWLDGSSQNPEAVLNPYQTKLFQAMVEALETINKVSMPTMPNYSGVQTGTDGGVSVGDIIVNVDNLNTDDDYETLAQKVSDVLMERIGKTTVVGGLRINSF